MSENNKDFFEQLAGLSGEGDIPEPELVKADILSKKLDKPELEEKEVPINGADDGELGFEDAEGHLVIDVYQDSASIVIESTVAGVDANDIDVAITPESVTIKGKRSKKERVKKDDYLYQECFWGKFSRSVILPQEIDPEKSSASLKNGLLKIVLPKVNRQHGKKIKIKLD
ncbi:MAG: Hsp20/alpha crystallin family protein [Candidatus Pacebacteria bacterium]|nr:Hsp20/alpha crystallin family protein [Candidatus Paceibacterota bacterium]